jgi:hypothetical protein
MEFEERRKGKENDRSVMSQIMRCEGRGYKDVYWKLLKEGVGKGKEVRESN